jgi:hypothetical protein
MADWCAGKKAWIDMVDCNGRTRIAQYVAPGGPASVSLVGSAVVTTPPTCDVYFEIGTNDTTDSFKRLVYARAKITC